MNRSRLLNFIPKLLNSNAVLLAFAAGLTFLLVTWIFEFIHTRTAISFEGVAAIHKNNPLLYIFDSLPVFYILVVAFFESRINKEKQQNLNSLTGLEQRMDAMAQFARQIGQGNYKATLSIEQDHDILAESLVLMRDNLNENSRKEYEQSWITAGKEAVSNLLRIHGRIEELAASVTRELTGYINAVQGAMYIYDHDNKTLKNISTYAFSRKKFLEQEIKVGHGLIGECAYEMEYIYRTEIPDDYFSITSGILGQQKPKSLLLIPLVTNESLQGVMEFASLESSIPEITIRFLNELGEIIARTLFNLKVTNRTEHLLRESQQMTEELKENEEELRQNAEEMRATQEELQKTNDQLQHNIQGVENAQKRQYSLLENASEVISIYDENMSMKYVSPSVLKILGFTPEEMMRGKDLDRLTRKGESTMRNMFASLLEKPEEPVTVQYTYMKKNGQKIFLESTGRNLLGDPAINGIILNSSDITERKRAEREERLKSKMQALSENSLDLIIRISTAGQFFYANPIVKNFLGTEPSELINKTLQEISMSDKLLNYFRGTIEAIKSNPGKTSSELTIPGVVEGILSERIMQFASIPEFNENELETILFVGHDITEAKQIELEIQDKNRKIEDSINYAQRIQTSILPEIKAVRQALPRSFIYYKPRDIVSGDFPWFFRHGDDIYIAAVDCTGHGVPGALLSFVGYFLLNNIVDRERKLTAAEICDMLHQNVRKTLKQDNEDAEARDGMDIAFCKINHLNREIQYAGAHRPLYFLRGQELTEYKGDRKAIGGIPHRKKEEERFTNYIINYERGDKIFFFSDGLPDQLGGPEDKKYSPKRIREMIVQNNNLPVEKFSRLFSSDFEKWRGDSRQIDDVLLIGIEF